MRYCFLGNEFHQPKDHLTGLPPYHKEYQPGNYEES